MTLAGGELVNTAGNVVHWLGFGWAGRLRRAGRRRRRAAPHEVGFASGAALVVRREAWDAVGGFDDALLHVRRGPRPRRCGCGWRAGGSASCRRRASSTTTSSPRATTSGSTSSATAGGRCSAPTRRALLALLAPGAAGLRGRAAARRVARRLAAARSCARRPRCCARCPRCCGAAARCRPRGAIAPARVRRGARGVAGLALPRGRGARPGRRRRAAPVLARRAGGARVGVHLGLDLLFLVPGASGGRETYARELHGGDPRAARRPAGDGLRQPRDGRDRARVLARPRRQRPSCCAAPRPSTGAAGRSASS